MNTDLRAMLTLSHAVKSTSPSVASGCTVHELSPDRPELCLVLSRPVAESPPPADGEVRYRPKAAVEVSVVDGQLVVEVSEINGSSRKSHVVYKGLV